MRVCGIEIKANEIVVCVLSLDRGLFEAPEIRQRRLNIANADDPKQLRAFQQTVTKLLDDYKVDRMAIKTRPQKGKFAGSASGFKLEATLQLMESHRAYLISAAVIKETQKYHPLPVDFKDTGLKAYQEQAFMAAYTQLVGPRHPPKIIKEESTTDEPANENQDVAAEWKKTPKKTKREHSAPTQAAPAEKEESPWGEAKKRNAANTVKPAPTPNKNPWKKR